MLSAYKRLQGKSRVAAVGCIGSWCRLLTRGCRGKLQGCRTLVPSAKLHGETRLTAVYWKLVLAAGAVC